MKEIPFEKRETEEEDGQEQQKPKKRTIYLDSITESKKVTLAKVSGGEL